MYNPYLVHHSKEWHRFFSHALVHSDYMHLFINMIVLFSFGRYTEGYFTYHFGVKGILYFVALYAGGVMFASLPAMRKHQDNPGYNAVGASGAVSAVLYSAIMIDPVAELRLYFAIPIPAFLFGILYLFYEYKMDKRGQGRIAHDAHLWGAIYGIAATIIFEPSLALSFFPKIIFNYFG